MWDSPITVEEAPSEFASHRESAERNWAWLESHRRELMPAAVGKFLAVADQEAFVAETLDAALLWVRTVHPNDTGHIVEYVWPTSGPRVYYFRLC